MAKGWQRAFGSADRGTTPAGSDPIPQADWQTLIELASDVSEGDDKVLRRLTVASRDFDEFGIEFFAEEPDFRDHFDSHFDAEGEDAPLRVFGAVMEASWYLRGVDWKFAVPDIVGNLNHQLVQLGGVHASRLCVASQGTPPKRTGQRARSEPPPRPRSKPGRN